MKIFTVAFIILVLVILVSQATHLMQNRPSLPASAADQVLKTYTNTAMDFSLSHPTTWVVNPCSANNPDTISGKQTDFEKAAQAQDCKNADRRFPFVQIIIHPGTDRIDQVSPYGDDANWEGAVERLTTRGKAFKKVTFTKKNPMAFGTAYEFHYIHHDSSNDRVIEIKERSNIHLSEVEKILQTLSF